MTPRPLTVAAHEVAKFSRVRNSWWTPNGALSSLHQFNPIRVNFISDNVQKYWRPASSSMKANSSAHLPSWGIDRSLHILDVGCGGGILSESLARLGGTVLGIDACAASIEAAKERLESLDEQTNPWKSRLAFEEWDLLELVERKSKFDVVVATEVIEHVEDARSFLEGLCAATKPGGVLILSTMDKSIKTAITHILVGEYLSGIIPRGTHDWSKFIPPKDISRFTSRFGFKDAQLKYIFCRPDLYQSIASGKMQLKFSLTNAVDTGHYFWAGVKLPDS